ncbi:MAG TPA: 4-alpha-glucanotransferase [Planctomycetaceae bacterium]|jgi:4-alpha-glucanotransferase|nr:4-alpha-glucanotransferase [Planctomycetaceae bacterium]
MAEPGTKHLVMKGSAFPLGSRGSGLLLHISSLPSRWGVGDFGPPALAWIDRLADAGQGWWQVLPLGPPGRGNSPYEPFSTFALNELFVSPDWLIEDNLLDAGDAAAPAFSHQTVDYDAVGPFKRRLLERAHDNFRSRANPELRRGFDEFCQTEAQWLDDYALFRAVRERHGDADFRDWPAELRQREPAALAQAGQEVAETVDRFRFSQFLLHRQQRRLQDYARQKHVGLIGDLAFLVAPDSADVWAHPEFFLLDPDGRPTFLAGVPPDYFSADGQLWGNPLYNWDALRSAGYGWWIDRIRSVTRHADVVRLDHFRAFAAAWHIPAGSATAQIGEWRPGPGADFFAAAEARLGPPPLIAEDLGLITADVAALRDQLHFPGMRVLQFAFDGDPKNPFLPENYPTEVVAYTGTHDNNTARGWYESLPEAEQRYLWNYLGRPSGNSDEVAWEFLRLAWESRAVLAVAPLQDVLNLGAEARMNWPGRPLGNWGWRATEEQTSAAALQRLHELTQNSGRG